MKNLKKKGFTIVELVIVIAVIAVLAAVLIPTFTNLTKKANMSAKTQIVRNINMALATNVEGHKTMHDALQTVEANGYVVEKLTPTEDGFIILYDIKQARFLLVDENGEEVYPKDGKTSTNKVDLWKTSDTYNPEGYSVYLTDAFTGTTLEVTTGVDVGNNPVTQVTYTGANNVTIRTLGNCQFNVTGTGTVDHYGEALVELGNTHNCHADVYQQGNDNQTGIDKGFAGGNGTQEQPYLVTSSEQFATVASVADENTYFEILTDVVLDSAFTSMGTESQPITGHIDFNNKTIYTEEGFRADGIFNEAKDLTISNLNLDLKAETSLVYYAADNVTLENVNVYGEFEGEKQWTSPFISMPYASDEDYAVITLKNCNNYANIRRNGYVGVFIGRYAGKAEVRIHLENCNNYGNIISLGSGASLIFSNPSHGGSENPFKLYIKNVRNYGTIMGKEGAGLVTTKAGNAGFFEYTEGNQTLRPLYFYSDSNFENLITDSNGQRIKLTNDETPSILDVKNAASGINVRSNYSELTVKSDKTFDLSTIQSSNAVQYVVTFNLNGYGKMNGGACKYTFVIDSENIETAKIYAYEWLNYDVYDDSKAIEKAEGEILEHNEFGLKYYTCGEKYVFKQDGSTIRKQPLVIAYAINEEGEIFNVSSYNYPTK